MSTRRKGTCCADTSLRVCSRSSCGKGSSCRAVINAGNATLTPAGTPDFSAGEFSGEAHYLLFTGMGTRSGWIYPVSGHDTSTLTIDLEGDDLAGVTDGDPFEVLLSNLLTKYLWRFALPLQLHNQLFRHVILYLTRINGLLFC